LGIGKKKFIKVMVPVLVLVVSFSLLFLNNMDNELTLPNDNWSREIDLPLTTGNAAPFVAEENGQYHIYGINKANNLDHLVIDEELNVINKSIIEVDIPPLKPFWANGDDVVFIRDNNLILFSSGKEQILAKNIDGLSANEELLIFWQDNKIYTLDQEYNSILINEIEYQIEEVVLDKYSSDSFLVVSKPKNTLFQFTLLQREQSNLFNAKDIYTLTEYSGETVSKFNFATNGSRISIIYTTYSIKNGIISYNNYFTEADIDQLDAGLDFKDMGIYKIDTIDKKDENNINYFEVVIAHPPLEKKTRYFELAYKDNTPTILFSSNGNITPKREAVNIYEAKNIDGNWIAERRTKTKDMSVKPAWLNDETIIWLDFVGSNSYDLKGASTNPNVIEKSLEINSEDIKFALSDNISGLAVSLLVIFNAMVWVIPPTILIIIILIFDINLIERNVRWVRITGIALYLITQYFSHKNVFNDNFSQYAPDYLNFSYNYIIIPLILAAISGIYRAAIRNDEWDSIKELFAFIGINLLMYVLLLGPYIL